MKIIGLTGGIGSGKSTVASMFQELGVPIYYADQEAKNLMNTSHELKKGVRDLFGDESYIDGILNRAFIANIVFKDQQQLKNLNDLVHPAVRLHFLDWIKNQQAVYVMQENALIFEKNNQNEYDLIITVSADLEHRISRVMARDGVQKSQVLERMNNQFPDDLKIKESDYVIINNSLQNTRQQVGDLHEKLLKQFP